MASNANEPKRDTKNNKNKKKNNNKITPLSDAEIMALVDELRADYTSDTDAESAEVWTSNSYNFGCPHPECQHCLDTDDCDKYGCEYHSPDHSHGAYVSDLWPVTWSGYRTRRLLRNATASAKLAAKEVPTGVPRYRLDPAKRTAGGL